MRRFTPDPVFSPDGNKIAYVSTQPSGYFNLYVRGFDDGNWQGDAIAVSSDNDFGRSRLYFGRWDMQLAPAWLPSGEELLLVSNRDIPLGSGNVLRVPAIENGIAQAQTVLSEQSLYRTRPDVSIDGKRFVYASTAGSADQYNNLYVQPTVGGEPYKLTFFENDAFHPRWSPDGETLAFISNAGGLPQLMLLEVYGGKTHAYRNFAAALLSPDGRGARARERGGRCPMQCLTAFMSWRRTGNSTLRRMPTRVRGTWVTMCSITQVSLRLRCP